MDKIRILSRRTLLHAASGLAGAAVSCGLVPRGAGAEEKLSQADAKYQNHPKGQQRCEICLQFQAPNSCQLVDGRIAPKGWCQYFAARENAH